MNKINELQQQVKELKKSQPQLRNRNSAEELGISEFEYLTLDIGPDRTLLEGDWKELLKEIHKMGYVMALTRNESCVHERKGVYDNISFTAGHANMGVAVNDDIDLRFFMNHWVYGISVIVRREKLHDLYSLQFFNEEGEAVHKIYTTDQSNLDAYHKIVKQYKATNQTSVLLDNTDAKAPKVQSDNPNLDVEAFKEDWLHLKDTHGFFGLLRKHKTPRIQALENAPEGLTEKIDNNSVIRMLEIAVKKGASIMCFTGSKGCIQIHSGPVKNLKEMRGWFNILDPKFNLHLRTQDIVQSWIVKKPTKDGIVTSLELFDKNGELITYFFGARKPGIPELESWREIIAETSVATVN